MRGAWREFFWQIKLNLKWPSPLGYETRLYSYDTIAKALLHLPYALGKKFYDFTRDFSLIDRNVNLMFET